MEYKIRDLTWFKRRPSVNEPKPVSVYCDGFKFIHDSYCEMVVWYDDGEYFNFNGQVSLNEIHGTTIQTWTVHGFSSESGRQCLIEVIE